MTGWLKRFRTRRLNLDLLGPPGAQPSIDVVLGEPVLARTTWSLIRLIFKQCLYDSADAMQIFHDKEDDIYRLLYCLPVDGHTWYEMVPAPPETMNFMVNLLRRRAKLTGTRYEGQLEYLNEGQLRSALCISRDESEMVIYFGKDRPRTINKIAGEKPGIPLAQLDVAATG